MSKADKAIILLDELVTQLEYFYGGNKNFRRDVLTPATQIENTLKDLAINKKETFKRIAKRYKDRYEKKLQDVDITGVNGDVSDITGEEESSSRFNPGSNKK